MKYILLSILVALFALNMGGGNFAVSFAAAHGSRILSKRKAQILFAVFVFLGAVLLGRPVANTLGSRIIPAQLMDLDLVLIILISATASLFVANLLRVPQSTSLVTVGAILGVGLCLCRVYGSTFLYLSFFWILFPVLGYVLTYFLGKLIYPPRRSNFWIYEKLVNNSKRLKAFVVAASCYNAFSVGANNVANAVGPLSGTGIISMLAGFALVAPLFGLGGVVFGGTLKTTGEKIVPLGLLTATIICIVTGTLMITASVLGVPQSFVMIKMASVFAVSGLKNGHRSTFTNSTTQKTYVSWIVMPVIATAISYVLTAVKLKFFG